MNKYLDIFIDEEYPDFIDKYLTTKTLTRLKYVTQFCGCDYTKLYSPLFKYTRFDHSLVVAHMTWHFTHDKKETIVALLHDAGTPCFAHCIDYVLGDYLSQESSERSVVDVIKEDGELLKYLKEDGLSVNDFTNFSNYHILENKSPRLCTDRFDGILHTSYIWLGTKSLADIKVVYNDAIVLKNEDGINEIGFKNIGIALKFVDMVFDYAKELQANKGKYVSMFVAEIIKIAIEKKILTLNDLYTKKEEEICNILDGNFSSWEKFNNAYSLVSTDVLPKNKFYISYDTKKRNAIPLVLTLDGCKRIDKVSKKAAQRYHKISLFKDKKYAYAKEIKSIE